MNYLTKEIRSISFLLFCCLPALAQSPPRESDSTLNNLVHHKEYKTSELGAVPEYQRSGKGRPVLILIPGLGFDASVFSDFITANEDAYTMYSVTTPGFGNTKAPAMPPAGTSYAEQSWNKGALEGLVRLIEKEKLDKPVVVGHFVQGTQLALNLAIQYPDKIRGVIILGGPAKFAVTGRGDPKQYTLETTVRYINEYWAPKWFKPISRKNFDEGNYLPAIYSLDSLVAQQLWKQPAGVPLPVMVRYLCEFFASDVTPACNKIKCPVLVVRPMFDEVVLKAPINNYIGPQFIEPWNDVAAKNSLIKVKDIPHAASCVWKDNPTAVYKEIANFLTGLKE